MKYPVAAPVTTVGGADRTARSAATDRIGAAAAALQDARQRFDAAVELVGFQHLEAKVGQHCHGRSKTLVYAAHWWTLGNIDGIGL
jgi:hypothetical protein